MMPTELIEILFSLHLICSQKKLVSFPVLRLGIRRSKFRKDLRSKFRYRKNKWSKFRSNNHGFAIWKINQKKFEAKESPSEDRPSQGQGQESSRPAKVKDQGHRRKRSPKKKVFKKIFQAISNWGKQKTSSQIFREVSKKFQRFKKYCCSRAEARAIFKDLRLRGQSQGLDLRGQGSDVATGGQGAVSP